MSEGNLYWFTECVKEQAAFVEHFTDKAFIADEDGDSATVAACVADAKSAVLSIIEHCKDALAQLAEAFPGLED